jgi:O-antigen/teichoic acid export membrane protein
VIVAVALVHPTVPLFYAGYLVGGAVPLALYTVLLARAGWFAGVKTSGGEHRRTRRELVHESTKLFVGRLAMAMTYRLDRLILAALSSPEQLGYYAAAVALADVAILFPTAVSQLIWRRAATSELDPTSPEGVARLSLVAIAVAAATAVALAVLAPMVVRELYGARYEASVGPLRVLAFGSFFVAVWRIVATDLLARGHGRRFTTGACISLVVTVAGCAALIPRYGASGAAAASVAAYAVAAGLAVWWSTRHGVLRPRS